jgi:hypothetical protein
LLKTAFSAIVIPTRHGVGFYPGQTPSSKLFPANGTMGTQSTITQSTPKLTRHEAATDREICYAKLASPQGR